MARIPRKRSSTPHSYKQWDYGSCWSSAHPHSCGWSADLEPWCSAEWNFFNALLKACEEAKLARQRRIEIEKECREIIKHLEAYQNQFKEVFEQYFHETTKFFDQSFNELRRVLCAGDADLAIGVNNKSREWLGQKALFDNKQEGWELITSNKNIRM